MSAMLTMIWPMARNGFTESPPSMYGDGWYHERQASAGPPGSSRDDPVMPSQRGRPVSSQRVGATSARTPSWRRRPLDRPARDQDRDRAERVGRDGPAVGVAHHVGVAMVGGDHEERARVRPRARADMSSTASDDPGEGRVDRCEPLHRRLPDARVADHVRVREVRHDQVVVAELDRLDQLVGDAAARSSRAARS